MRVYRWVILTILAGLTVLLLGTAVYALQTPSEPPPSANNQQRRTPSTLTLRSQKQGTNYLAIVIEETFFLDPLSPLLDYRKKTGLQKTAVSLSQINAELGNREIRDSWLPASEDIEPAKSMDRNPSLCSR